MASDLSGFFARKKERGVRDIAGLNGFEAISTPIFEFTEVFKRPLGEASDVVSKEM